MFETLHEITTVSLIPVADSANSVLRVSPLQTAQLLLTFTLSCNVSTPQGQLQSKRFLGHLASHSLDGAWVNTLSHLSLVPFIVPDDASSVSGLRKRISRERANGYQHGRTILVPEGVVGLGAEPLCAPIEAVPEVGFDATGRRVVTFHLPITIPSYAAGGNILAILCKLRNPSAIVDSAGVGLGSPLLGTVAQELQVTNPLSVKCSSRRVSNTTVLLACSVTNEGNTPLTVLSIQPDLLSSWIGSTLGSLADVRQDPRYRSAAPYHHGAVVGTLAEVTSVVPIVPATGFPVFPVHLGPMEAYSAAFCISLKPEYATAGNKTNAAPPTEGRMNIHSFVERTAINASLDAVVTENFNTVVVVKYGDEAQPQRHEEHAEWSFNPVHYAS